MPKRIEKLTIKDFRGATVPLDVDFDKSKPMVMIFGENGTGKSSIVDALDFVCNQKYGCLEGRSSVKKKNHLPALDKTKNDISITLKFDNNEWIAHHQNADPVTSPSGFPNANILRRSSILKLIDSRPNERYKELSEFLSVPDIEKCEDTLGKAVRNQEREFNESALSVTQAKEELENLQNELKEADKSVEEWSKEVTEIKEEELKKIIKNAEELEALQQKYKATQQELIDAKEQFDQDQLRDTGAKAELKKFQEQESSKEDLQRLLNRAKKYFSLNKDVSICPVCEQEIKNNEILKRLTQRLEDMATLTELMTTASSAEAKKKQPNN